MYACMYERTFDLLVLRLQPYMRLPYVPGTVIALELDHLEVARRAAGGDRGEEEGEGRRPRLHRGVACVPWCVWLCDKFFLGGEVVR